MVFLKIKIYKFFFHLLFFLLSQNQYCYSNDFKELLHELKTKKFSKKIEAIKKIGASGNEETEKILKALLSGKIYYRKSDKKIFIVERKENKFYLIDPITKKKLGPVKKNVIKKIRINNKIRSITREILGSLRLFDENPKKRGEAAKDVFKSKSQSILNILKERYKLEKNENIKLYIKRSIASITLSVSNIKSERENAINILSEFKDNNVRNLLSEISNNKDDELFNEAKIALVKIEKNLFIWEKFLSIYQGISLGSVLLLASIGLAITFGVMGVINMAHGELVMIGAYATYVTQNLLQKYFPQAIEYSLVLAIPIAFLVAGAIGILIERSIIRYLYGRPLQTLLATWGVSLVLQQLMRTIFGPTNKNVETPTWMTGAIETSSGLAFTYNRIYIIIFSLFIVGIIGVVLKNTFFGLQMRAVTQNRIMAGSMGIPTGWIDALTFGLGSGIAGVAGVALSQIDNVSPNLGQSYIIDSFMVVVFGGVGNLWGTLLGAFSLGITNKFLEPFSGAVLAKIFVLVGIIIFIQKKPRGLFALKGRAVEV